MTHHIKCWPSQFQAVWDGVKTAELRFNDRDYRVGDTIVMYCWDPEKKNYSPKFDRIGLRVTHITGGFGLDHGYVMLSFQIVSRVIGLQCPWPLPKPRKRVEKEAK